jgi:hypothetical protein
MLMPSPSSVIAGLAQFVQEPRTIDLWDAWAFAELDAEFALERWWAAADSERAIAFAAYGAALEREAQAAAVLEARLRVTAGPVSRSY